MVMVMVLTSNRCGTVRVTVSPAGLPLESGSAGLAVAVPARSQSVNSSYLTDPLSIQ